MAAVHVVQPIVFSNMLLGLQEPNVTFCLDSKCNLICERLKRVEHD